MQRQADGRHIYLIGFSGSGKSTVGKALASRLGRGFVDIDRLIERRTGRTIFRLFLERGEPAFRKLESAVVAEVAKHHRPQVVALGGGAFERARNRRVVDQSGVSIYLTCSMTELYRRLDKGDDRPLLRAKPQRDESLAQARRRRIKELLERRRSRYLRATIKVSTTGKSVSNVVNQIEKKLRRACESD